jgi:hypothetical protein
VIQEVVERIIERDRGVRTPQRSREWCELLNELAAQLGNARSPIASQHWNHGRLATALNGVLTALDQATPGGLERLSRR